MEQDGRRTPLEMDDTVALRFVTTSGTLECDTPNAYRRPTGHSHLKRSWIADLVAALNYALRLEAQCRRDRFRTWQSATTPISAISRTAVSRRPWPDHRLRQDD
jgi:hypothetical protein